MTPTTSSTPTTRSRPRLIACAVGALLILSLCLAPAASAESEFEPNDTFETAYGPLAADATYPATLETEEDVDTYYFYATNPEVSQVNSRSATRPPASTPAASTPSSPTPTER